MNCGSRVIQVVLATRIQRAATVGCLLLAGTLVQFGMGGPAGATTPVVGTTTSHYEQNTATAVLFAEGQSAGASGAHGLVILDFGRPAVNGPLWGTVDFTGGFASFASIELGAERYIDGYFATAPTDLPLDVVIGTNDSCGTGQPCGTVVCGCTFEPPSFTAWGAQLAAAVRQVQAHATNAKERSGYTDTVTVMAGDDAEPGFDPGYQNTYDLMDGYAQAVGGFAPAMVDYGSADPGIWSEAQLLQIANGFPPNLAVPEIYSAADASRWASLASYAKGAGQPLTFFGVLTGAPSGAPPATGYSAFAAALQPITGQDSFRWFSNISP
jgi:hypothetical protein